MRTANRFWEVLFSPNFWVRPSIEFLDPPPLPRINFVHDLDFNYFQRKNIYFVKFNKGLDELEVDQTLFK